MNRPSELEVLEELKELNTATLLGSQAAHQTVHQALPHESALLHVRGTADYVDDLRVPHGTLHGALGLATQTHARLLGMNLDAVRAAPGVVAVLTNADVPGHNNIGPLLADDTLFAQDEVLYHGHPLFLVVAESHDAAMRAANLAKVDYEPLPAWLTAEQGHAAGAQVLPTRRLQRGQAQQALARAKHRIKGTLEIGGQEHFYLEGQVALAIPSDEGVLIHSSTQHPTDVQELVAHLLGRPASFVTVQCRRMGGGFGGKESQAVLCAAATALAALKLRRPVKLRLERDTDMTITGKRHDFTVHYEVGFDDAGRLDGVRFEFLQRCGYSADLSGPVGDRAMFMCANAYYLADVEIVSHRVKTHTVSNTAFRGFGGPQGALAIEYVMDAIARQLGKDPLEVRRVNFYGEHERNVTHYGQPVEDFIVPRLVDELERRADYHARREAMARFNASSPVIKRGLALVPVKFGISFTVTFLNQAGALVQIYKDGSVAVNHGGTEMGQGLFTKVAQVAAEVLGVPMSQVRVLATNTEKVPNTSATAASTGADLNGQAVADAAHTLRQRLTEFLAKQYQVAPEAVRFAQGRVQVPLADGVKDLSFAEVVHAAWLARVSLSAAGFYRTPKIHYDVNTMQGRPFFYFAYGASASEVEVDTLTGESHILRTDILHDVGRSLNPALDRGQVEGAFVQGVGWLTSEELYWNAKGELKTHAPSTYKIPTAFDMPQVWNTELVAWSTNREDTIFRSKAVGEPPLLHGFSVFLAIRDALASVTGKAPALHAPATPENILKALGRC